MFHGKNNYLSFLFPPLKKKKKNNHFSHIDEGGAHMTILEVPDGPNILFTFGVNIKSRIRSPYASPKLGTFMLAISH
jgi:hypothetical protein